MSVKSLSKTRWKIEQDRVTIYPYGVFYFFTAIIAIIFTGLVAVYMYYENASLASALPLVLIALLIIILFWCFAGTYIEFDNSKGRMRKMLLGFLPSKTIQFDKLEGINVISNTTGSYNYRLFKKEDRYGSGIIVSSGYTRNDDANAIAFVEEAVPVINDFLNLHDPLTPPSAQAITDYRFFNEQGGVYTIKNKKAGALIFGIIFLATGVALLGSAEGIMGKLVLMAVTGFLALIFFNAAFTKITFDANTQTIERSGLTGFFNRKYQFAKFASIQTLRRSINFVYAGTDINMYFDVPEKNGKQEMLTVISLKKSSDIERFMAELYQII